MMKHSLFLMALSVGLLVCKPVHAQKGRDFPYMKTTTLKEETVALPKATEGKLAVLALARSKKAEEALNTWMQPLYQTFIQDYKEDDWLAPAREDYDDVKLFFIPMFSGLNKMATNKVRKDMRTNLPEKFHQYMLLFEGKDRVYEEKLKMKDKKEPYFFVLDKKGHVSYATSGRYTENKLDGIEDAIEANR